MVWNRKIPAKLGFLKIFQNLLSFILSFSQYSTHSHAELTLDFLVHVHMYIITYISCIQNLVRMTIGCKIHNKIQNVQINTTQNIKCSLYSYIYRTFHN